MAVANRPATNSVFTYTPHRCRIAEEDPCVKGASVEALTSEDSYQSLEGDPKAHGSISAGQPVGAVSVGLLPATTGAGSRARAAGGSVFVESRPPAAQVFLDGERVGRTPVTLSDVAAGLHEIRIQRDGYRVWSTTTRVVASERARGGASLDRTARP